MAPSNGTTVSERPAVVVSGNGNAAATPAEAEEGQPGRAAGGDVDDAVLEDAKPEPASPRPARQIDEN